MTEDIIALNIKFTAKCFISANIYSDDNPPKIADIIIRCIIYFLLRIVAVKNNRM